MPVKSVIGIVMVLASTAACTASVAEDDRKEDGATATVNAELYVRGGDDVPAPLDYPLPSLGLEEKRVLWDLRPIGEEERTRLFGQCAMHYVKLYDPGRGRHVEIPVTVCN